MASPHETALQELKARLREIYDLSGAAGLLHWDQATHMPPGGAAARGRQLAALRRILHQKSTDPEIGRLLEALRPYEESLPDDHDDAALLRVARRNYEKAVRVPEAFVVELTRHTSESFQVWAKARPANDFEAVRPYLEKTVEMSRRFHEFFPEFEHVADPLIDLSDEGMTVALLKPLFEELRAGLLPIVQAVADREVDDRILRGPFPEERQLAFVREVVEALGYDFSRGRIDKTHHPFMIKFSLGDVRITTRVKETDLGECLFSTIHEAGHAMYEQGIDPKYEGTPLAGGASSGVHESQSRLWENLVGRSRPFWTHFFPRLQEAFPETLKGADLETFYRAINKVERSLIRTDADEVTYNFHVIIRFELELELLEGKLAVKDLPEAWRARYAELLGVEPPDHRDGVLQDVHWYSGTVGGAFQGYTLGNLMAAQIFEAALEAHPEIPDEIAAGRFETLRTWLTENLYRHGRKFKPLELIERVTGKPLSAGPYLLYLRRKYGELYGVEL